jgi:hypothetical protein
VFFELASGLRLALWPRDSIARDSGLVKSASSPTDFTLGHNVRSKADVDAVMTQAETAGARIIKRAADTFWGRYAGISRIRTGIYGKWSGIRILSRKISMVCGRQRATRCAW